MANADKNRVVAKVFALLNRPSLQVLPYQDVHAVRIDAGMEVLKAIADNPQNGYFGPLSSLVTIAHQGFLPAHDGKPGIPLIVPYNGADAIAGKPATPEQIDQWRTDVAAAQLIQTATDGDPVPHDQSDAQGFASPVAGFYSMTNGVFRYTGYSAQVPLVQLTRSMADSAVPEVYEPTLVKLAAARSIVRNSKNPETMATIRGYGTLAAADLAMIRQGKEPEPVIPDVEAAQKAGAA